MFSLILKALLVAFTIFEMIRSLILNLIQCTNLILNIFQNNNKLFNIIDTQIFLTKFKLLMINFVYFADKIYLNNSFYNCLLLKLKNDDVYFIIFYNIYKN